VPDLRKETAMTLIDIPFRFPLTAEEFEQLPPIEGVRVELSEGRLEMAAAAQMRWHAHVMRRIANVFEAGGREVSTETGVVLAPRTVREPDVTRFRQGVKPAMLRSQFDAADVDLVVEIVSPESERRDRTVKPEEYAGARIREFWLVESDPDDDRDALINIYRLTPRNAYALVETVALSKLESEAHS
jgi:Uma2 family endonuclease